MANSYEKLPPGIAEFLKVKPLKFTSDFTDFPPVPPASWQKPSWEIPEFTCLNKKQEKRIRERVRSITHYIQEALSEMKLPDYLVFGNLPRESEVTNVGLHRLMAYYDTEPSNVGIADSIEKVMASGRMPGRNTLKQKANDMNTSTITFQYANGKPYTIRNVINFTMDFNLVGEFKEAFYTEVETTKQTSKRSNVKIDLTDCIGLIRKEKVRGRNITTAIENPAYDTTVKLELSTIRSKTRAHNKEVRENQKKGNKKKKDDGLTPEEKKLARAERLIANHKKQVREAEKSAKKVPTKKPSTKTTAKRA